MSSKRYTDKSKIEAVRQVTDRGFKVADVALRLCKALGRTPESWLAMQDSHDLWVARKTVNLNRVAKLDVRAA